MRSSWISWLVISVILLFSHGITSLPLKIANNASSKVPLLRSDLITNLNAFLQSKEFTRLKRYFVLSRVHYDERMKSNEGDPNHEETIQRGRSRFTKLTQVERPFVHGVLVSPSPVVWETHNPSLVPLKQRIYIPGKVPSRIPPNFFSREPSKKKRPISSPKSQSIVQIRPRQSNIYGISRRRSVVEEGDLQGADPRRSAQTLLTVKRRGEGWSGGMARGRFLRNKRTQRIREGYIPVRRLRPIHRREASIGVEKRFLFDDRSLKEPSTPSRCLKCYVFWTQRSKTISRSSIYEVCCGREAIP